MAVFLSAVFTEKFVSFSRYFFLQVESGRRAKHPTTLSPLIQQIYLVKGKVILANSGESSLISCPALLIV